MRIVSNGYTIIDDAEQSALVRKELNLLAKRFGKYVMSEDTPVGYCYEESKILFGFSTEDGFLAVDPLVHLLFKLKKQDPVHPLIVQTFPHQFPQLTMVTHP